MTPAKNSDTQRGTVRENTLQRLHYLTWSGVMSVLKSIAASLQKKAQAVRLPSLLVLFNLQVAATKFDLQPDRDNKIQLGHDGKSAFGVSWKNKYDCVLVSLGVSSGASHLRRGSWRPELWPL